jgi:hypothetical protein
MMTNIKGTACKCTRDTVDQTSNELRWLQGSTCTLLFQVSPNTHCVIYAFMLQVPCRDIKWKFLEVAERIEGEDKEKNIYNVGSCININRIENYFFLLFFFFAYKVCLVMYLSVFSLSYLDSDLDSYQKKEGKICIFIIFCNNVAKLLCSNSNINKY